MMHMTRSADEGERRGDAEGEKQVTITTTIGKRT